MNITFFSLFTIFCFSLSTVQCMESSDNTNQCELPKQNKYDCQKLKTEHPSYEHFSLKQRNSLFDEELEKWLYQRKYQKTAWTRLSMAKHTRAQQEKLSTELACLVCWDVNPNRQVVKHWHKYLPEPFCDDPDYKDSQYLSSLAYAVETDNVELASFLIKHKARVHRTLREKIRDSIHGARQEPWLLKICSVEMAKIFVPHIGVEGRFERGQTIAHVVAIQPHIDKHLLEFYLDQDKELVDKTDYHGNTPLHLLANQCHDDMKRIWQDQTKNQLSKTKLLAQRTKKINVLNQIGNNAFDCRQGDCLEFTNIMQKYGGKTSQLYGSHKTE